MIVSEKHFRPSNGTTHRLTITNEQTGEVEVQHENIAGGFYIFHQTDDGELGTRQGAFGLESAIVLSAMKTPSVMRDLLNRIGVLDRVRDVAKAAGLTLTI